MRASPPALGRGFRIFLATATLFVLLPLQAGAAASWNEVLPTPDRDVVTQGVFLKAAMRAYRVAFMEDEKDLPYRGITPALMPYVQTAQELGVLAVFNKKFAPSRAITRGQAMAMMAAIDTLRPSKTTRTPYTDINPRTPEGRAALIALDKQWMEPASETLFGVHQRLTGKEARLLLSRATGIDPADIPAEPVITPKTKIKVPVIKVRVQPRAVERLPSQSVLDTVWHLLNEQYLYKEKIQSEEAGHKAVEGLVNSLADPYTQYMRPASARSFQSQLQGEITGIGAQVDQKAGVLTIVTPLPGSPAEKAGLQPGDEILLADDKALTGLGFDEAVSHVRGPRGSTVKLHIRRSGMELDVSVVRDLIKIPEVEISWQNRVAVVKLLQFGETTDRQLRARMQDIQNDKPAGIILDLRNNPGGLLHAASVVVSNFVPKGTPYASIHGKDSVETEVTEEEATILASVPLVVLVNQGSASASEITAGALQDHKRATLVGEKTYGKGTVQQVFHFDDGSSFKMTVAEWKTPAGRKIDGAGLAPDILVQQGQGGRDEPMLKALEILR